MIEVQVHEQPIELYKVLKFAGVCDSGGEAKAVVAEGLVTVNGQAETRKRRKIMIGDTIAYAGDTIRINLAPDTGG